MRYRLEDNVTGAVLSRWFDSWRTVEHACATLNSRPGAGGYAGVYDEHGDRRHSEGAS